MDTFYDGDEKRRASNPSVQDVLPETILFASEDASDLLAWDGDSGRQMSFALGHGNLGVFREVDQDMIGADLRSNRVHCCVQPSARLAEVELTEEFPG